METFLKIFQAIVSIFLILSILSQQKGTTLSLTFGGTNTFHHSKRGAEKVLARMTVVLAVLFIASTVTFIFV